MRRKQDQYTRQADELARLMSKGKTLKQAAAIVARKARRDGRARR